MFLEFWEPLSDKGPEAENPPSEHSTGIESHNSLRVRQIVHKIRGKKQFEIQISTAHVISEHFYTLALATQ